MDTVFPIFNTHIDFIRTQISFRDYLCLLQRGPRSSIQLQTRVWLVYDQYPIHYRGSIIIFPIKLIFENSFTGSPITKDKLTVIGKNQCLGILLRTQIRLVETQIRNVSHPITIVGREVNEKEGKRLSLTTKQLNTRTTSLTRQKVHTVTSVSSHLLDIYVGSCVN